MKKSTHLAAVAGETSDRRADPVPMSPAFGATLEGMLEDGTLTARTAQGDLLHCDCLETAGTGHLAPGDRVLVLMLTPPSRPVVMARIGRYAPPTHARIEASELVSIKCGESSLDLRADGKVVIKGDDVLVRAKGSKRIRAGTVSIN